MKDKNPTETDLTTEPETSGKKKESPNSWALWTRDIVVCLIIVLFFRGYVAEANYIPSPSMEPTLNVSDRIIVDKLSLHWRPLERGDLIVFHPPTAGHESERWIKRIIGLPGDTVQIVDGKVFINGEKLDEPYIRMVPAYSVEPVELDFDNPGTEQNEGEFYLLGDNRPNSRDSHVWGPCPADHIIGRAVFRYWPLDKIGLIQ